MQLRLLIGTLVAAATIAAGAALPATAATGKNPQRGDESERRLSKQYYGIGGHLLPAMAGGRQALLRRHLSRIEELGPSFVRAAVDWSVLEPHAPRNGARTYDFSLHDRWVGLLAQHGLRWYVLGTGTPRWALTLQAQLSSCRFAPPARVGDYAAMMRALAARYGRDGTFWRQHPELPYRPVIDYEIWNEPNLGSGWCPTPDPRGYGRLLAAAAPAIRSATSKSRIVFGGLAPYEDSMPGRGPRRGRISVREMLAGVVDAGFDLNTLVDAIGIHTYGKPKFVNHQLSYYRESRDALGLSGLPFSLNEIGWTTRGEGAFVAVGEQERARRMKRETKLLALDPDCDLIAYAPHTWISDERDRFAQADWFGLADPLSAEPYPSGKAYESAIAAFPAGEPLRPPYKDVCY